MKNKIVISALFLFLIALYSNPCLASSTNVSIKEIRLYNSVSEFEYRSSDGSAFGLYAKELNRQIANLWAERQETAKRDGLVAVAILPDKSVRLWLDLDGAFQSVLTEELSQKIKQLSPPVVTDGPAAFACLFTLNGGSGKYKNEAVPIPEEWRKAVIEYRASRAPVKAGQDEEFGLLVLDDILKLVWKEKVTGKLSSDVNGPAAGVYRELFLLKEYSRQELRKYARSFSKVDKKFEGVLNYGRMIEAADFNQNIDLEACFFKKKDYWRAVMEMAPSDPSVLFSTAHLYASQGYPDYASVCFLIASVGTGRDFSQNRNYLQYQKYASALGDRVKKEINKGIELHDRGTKSGDLEDYKKAIAVYERVIEKYPNCAGAFYEKSFSYLMMDGFKIHLKAGDDATAKDLSVTSMGTTTSLYANDRKKALSDCRARDPFYWQAYQGDDPSVIGRAQILVSQVMPFYTGSKERTLDSYKKFTEGLEKIDLYVLAAHARWRLALIDFANRKEHIDQFLSNLDKIGCEDTTFFRAQFKSVN